MKGSYSPDGANNMQEKRFQLSANWARESLQRMYNVKCNPFIFEFKSIFSKLLPPEQKRQPLTMMFMQQNQLPRYLCLSALLAAKKAPIFKMTAWIINQNHCPSVEHESKHFTCRDWAFFLPTSLQRRLGI